MHSLKINRQLQETPWHKVEGTKVCLVCLRRYEERLLPTIPTDNCNVNAKDPLGDDNDPVRLVEGCSTAIESNCEANDNRDGVYTRFLHILKRQFKMNLKNFRNAAIKNQVEPPFCDQCLDYVENMCNLYNELNKIKLLFYWRLCQISDAIKKSKTNVSYKLSVTLTKSLSTQLFVASSNSVNLLRRRMSLLSSNSSVETAQETPKVLINRNSCLLACQDKLLFPVNVMQQFMKSLIVIFTLGTPEMRTDKKLRLRLGYSKSQSNHSQESKKYCEGMKIKTEKARLKMELNEDLACLDTAYKYSPTNSGPASPIDNNDDNEDNLFSPRSELGIENDPDSDWSAHKNSDDSDVEFSINKAALPRRWNLRKRKSDQRMDTERDDTENDPDFSLQLPPLRGAQPARRGIDESERKFACNLCGMKFNSERYKRRHLSQAHSFFVLHMCPKCPIKFKKHKDLLLHKKKAHPYMMSGRQPPYKGVTTSCTVCQKEFPSRMKMMEHRKTHKFMQMKHTCEICGKVVIGQFRIELHRKSHERPDKSMRCLKCPRKFYTQEGFDAHSKLHDQNPNWKQWRKARMNKLGMSRKRLFKCDIGDCKKVFFRESNLAAHKTLHASSFSCATCEKIVVGPRVFRDHLLVHEKPDEKNHFCLHCDKSFTLAQTHEFHLKTNHPSKATLPCDEDYCTEEFANTETLLEHLKTHVGNTAAADSQTSHELEISIKREELNTSTDTDGIAAADDMKLGIYTCDRCKWSFCRKLHLTLHQLIHTPKNDKNMYECSQCDKTYRVVDSLQTHVNTIHGSKIKPYLCKICGVRFNGKESLISHMNMHTVTTEGISEVVDETKYFCTKCEATFDKKSSLEKHEIYKHPVMGVRIGARKCEDCEEVFSTRLLLLTHRHESHGMEKPYKCDHENCDKEFVLKSMLSKHKIYHAEKTLQCPMCPRLFSRPQYLIDHINAHTQEKNHVCDYCGRAFVKKSSLFVHVAIHKEDKKYMCTYCPKAFTRRFSLTCHIRVHTKEKPFVCQICGAAFSQHITLKNHLKIHERLNSTVVERRPFKKSVGIGAPLMRKTETEVEPRRVSTDPEPANVHPQPTVTQERRGRPRKDGMIPGKRLEPVVENVMEPATNKHIKIPTLNNMTTNASTQISQQRQLPQVTQHQIVHQQSSLIQSPSSMPMSPSPYSERSDSVSSTMSNNPINSTPNPIPFISPFLNSNPYLLPLENPQQSSPDYHNQQNFSTINLNQSRQHIPSSFPQTTSQSAYPRPQIPYQNMPQLQQQSTSSTIPQDLSKHSYSTFYANPR